ncbi:ImmA/IrrE family metallo-endopeptidase [Paenibacillus chungangensis]|uniref:ImmA/IrrE family metallo-endopeptidase n=1 Tax=Paenibacillus chungangensis TaxID=696535 RepID=A0ABW3HQX1_9BACL
MIALNFELYRPSDMERWIYRLYKISGIEEPSDLADLDYIASLFNAHIAYTEGETKAIYDEEGDCLIFLHIHMNQVEQRLAFFHELCHPAMHVGNQHRLPPSFVNLQEMQAGLFQQYAALPAFMLERFAGTRQQAGEQCSARDIAEAFMLPSSFVYARLERMKRRIEQEHQDQRLRERLASSSAGAAYSEATKKLLAKLERQIKKE